MPEELHLGISSSNYRKSKNKKKIPKEARERERKIQHLTYRAAKIRITSDFYLETMQARREQSKIFRSIEENKNNPVT